MPNPIVDAYATLAAALGQALTQAGFIADPDALSLDDPAADGLDGDALEVATSASLLTLHTRPTRFPMGAEKRRFVVERYAHLELVSVGPDKPAREALLNRAVAAVAALPQRAPTLEGACERLFLGAPDLAEQSDDDFGANGRQTLIAFTIRVRSGDPLGQTPTC
jgi:hypothetical protein